MAYSLGGIEQSISVLPDNPAVIKEYERLERRALDALLKWAEMDPFTRAISSELDRAVNELRGLRLDTVYELVVL